MSLGTASSSATSYRPTPQRLLAASTTKTSFVSLGLLSTCTSPATACSGVAYATPSTSHVDLPHMPMPISCPLRIAAQRELPRVGGLRLGDEVAHTMLRREQLHFMLPYRRTAMPQQSTPGTNCSCR